MVELNARPFLPVRQFKAVLALLYFCLCALGTSAFAQTASQPVAPESQLPSRPNVASNIPGRPSRIFVQGILAELQREQAADVGFQRSAAYFAGAFILYQTVHKDEEQDKCRREIDELRADLGDNFVPRIQLDVDALRSTFVDCIVTARGLATRGKRGKFGGPGTNSKTYVTTFLSPGAESSGGYPLIILHDDLEDVARQVARAGKARFAITQIEHALDTSDCFLANLRFLAMSKDATIQSPEFSRYLSESVSLRVDLEAYAQATLAGRAITAAPLTHIHELADEESSIQVAAAKPITSSYLRSSVMEDKESLNKQLAELQPFHTDVARFVLKHVAAASTEKQFTEQLDSASKDWEQLKRDLEAAHDLVEITSDPAAMQSIRSWYGSEVSDSLMTKAKEVEAAKENETSLMVYVGLATGARQREEAAIQQRREQAETRKQALIGKDVTRSGVAQSATPPESMMCALDEQHSSALRNERKQEVLIMPYKDWLLVSTLYKGTGDVSWQSSFHYDPQLGIWRGDYEFDPTLGSMQSTGTLVYKYGESDFTLVIFSYGHKAKGTFRGTCRKF